MSKISDVMKSSSEPSHLLDLFTSVFSDHTIVVIVSPVLSILLNRNNKTSVTSSSDRSGSPVEDPPLFDAVWVVVLDSQVPLMS